MTGEVQLAKAWRTVARIGDLSDPRSLAVRAAILVAVLIASQVLLWAMITTAERLSRPAGIASQAEVAYRMRGEDGALGTPAKAGHEGTDGYVVRAGDSDIAIVYSLSFEVTDPAKPQALYLSIREQIHEILVNGHLVQPQLALNKVRGVVNSEPGLYVLPARALKSGKNVITVEQSRFGYAYALPEFAIGPAEDLGAAYRWKTFFTVDLALGGIFILGFTALLVLVIDWPAGDRRRARALVALLLSSAVVTCLFSFTPTFGVPLNVIVCLLMLAGLGNSLAVLWYVHCDLGLPQAWLRRLAQGGLVLASLVILQLIAGLVAPELAARLTYLSLDLSHYVIAGVGILAVLLLAGAVAVLRPSRWGERLAVMVCLSTFALDHVSSLIDLTAPFAPNLPLTLYLSPVVGVLLGLAMLLSIARQAGESRRVVATANDVLEATLKAREDELRAGHERQQTLMQRQVLLEERQRIVRDMHDGIGGQLLGLMLQIRGGHIAPPAIEASLQTSIDDLRLIVDSLDSAEEGLSAALRAFEYRVRSQIEGAGLGFAVDLSLGDGDGLRPGPRASLQILRILQEALSNALRHAVATRLTLEGGVSDGVLTLRLGDDGRGFVPGEKGGRGLGNMKARAKRLGGQLDIVSGAQGTRVVFTVAVAGLNRLAAEEVAL
ncbi:ATP-binding protein [Asticcacaulis sp. AC402]|uniref:sensor histidine kinase n=1 Tax=Asticcacaulis sp. AC402 TaxID=1282361 RepID=UPI00138ABD64|nr:ATP-binding protein [Asticcacaulis sp. AC402]